MEEKKNLPTIPFKNSLPLSTMQILTRISECTLSPWLLLIWSGEWSTKSVVQMSQGLGRALPIKTEAICIVGLHEQETVEIRASLNPYLFVSSSWRWIHMLWIHRVKHTFKELSSTHCLWNNNKKGNGGDVSLFYIAFRTLVEQVRLPDLVFSLF